MARDKKPPENPYGEAEQFALEWAQEVHSWELMPAEPEPAPRLTVERIDAFHQAAANLLECGDVPKHVADKVRYCMKRVDECFVLTMQP